MIGDVLKHRMILKPESRLRNVKVDEVLVEIMDEIPVPMLERRTEVREA